jgi:frataxin-like iron-binding protein CyaY
MPIYNGIYYYMNTLDKVSGVVQWENRWWAKYNLFEDTNLPISIQKDQFPEADACPFALEREEFLSKLNDTAENLVIYTQSNEALIKIMTTTKRADGTSNWALATLNNGVTMYKQAINDKWGVVVLYDPNMKLYSKRVPVAVIVALIVAVAIITVASLVVFDNLITQSYTTQRQHEVLEAMRWYNRTVITDSNGNPIGEVWQFGNGSAYSYDYNSGRWTQLQAGASWGQILDTISQGNVGGMQNVFKFMTYAVIGGMALIVIFAILFFAMKSRGERVEVLKT